MAVTCEEKYFKSTSRKKIDVRYLVWKDDSVAPKAVFQITHGVQEHIGRYDDFARFLASHGYIVCGQDHLGHGKTAGLEKLGITPPDAGKKMVEDMHKLRGIISKEYPNIPYVLFGHSMGSYLSRSYTAKYGKGLSAAIYCGSCFMPSFTTLLHPVMKLMALVLGAEAKNEISAKLMSFVFNSGVRKPRTGADWLSFNEANVDEYLADPYSGGVMGNSLARDTIIVVSNGGKRGWQKKIPKELPIMVVSGAFDSTGLFGWGTSLLYAQIARAGIDATLRLYNGRHEILNDNCKQKVYDDILKFADEKIII